MVRDWKGRQKLDPGLRFLPHVKRVHHGALSGSPTRHALTHKISWHGLSFSFLSFFKNSLYAFYFLGRAVARHTGLEIRTRRFKVPPRSVTKGQSLNLSFSVCSDEDYAQDTLQGLLWLPDSLDLK